MTVRRRASNSLLLCLGLGIALFCSDLPILSLLDGILSDKRSTTTSMMSGSRQVSLTPHYSESTRHSNDNYIKQKQQQHTSAYTSPLQEFPPLLADLPLPPPLQVLEQYKAWHSHEALLRDPHNRTFILAHYQCPISVGNWLHYFTSAFLWGILTNRTILWRYVTNDICHDIRSRWLYPFNIQRCNVSASDPDVCHAMLSRAPWIPSYEEWKDRLQLVEEQDVYMIPLEYSGRDPVPKPRRPVDVYYRDYPVIDIHPWAFLRLDHLIHKPELRQQQLGTVYAHATLHELAKWGSSFLFGLLWRYSFDYAPEIREHVLNHPAIAANDIHGTDATTNNATMHNTISTDMRRQRVLSIALHSRHIHSMDDGCDIQLEQKCLLELMREYREQTNTPALAKVPCQVTLASDRTCTIDSLSSWMQETLDCQPVVTEHATTTQAVFEEHGPFSGSGFFQDMLLAGMTVKDAMIGSLEPTDGNRWRSSSELIEEAITYHRDMTYWQRGNDPEAKPELVECTLKRKDVAKGIVQKAN